MSLPLVRDDHLESNRHINERKRSMNLLAAALLVIIVDRKSDLSVFRVNKMSKKFYDERS